MSAALRNGSLLPTVANGPVNRMSALFDRFFSDGFFAPIVRSRAWTTMPLSVWEDEHNVYAEADLPGLTDKDIDVSVHTEELLIRGERTCQRQEGGYDTRSYGRFEQRVILPSAVDVDKAEAKLANGVLSLTLPKREDVKPHRIPLTSA